LHTIQKNLKEKPLKTGNSTFHVSFSYGLSAFEPDDKFDQVYNKADARMYEVKSTKSHYKAKLKK
jgi:GGDEF domain-containing protein